MNYVRIYDEEDMKIKKENIERMKKDKLDKITLLNINKICGENQLDIFKKFGLRASMTDFARILGGYISVHGSDYTIDNKRSSAWWTGSEEYYISGMGTMEINNIDNDYRGLGIRPALIFPSNISNYYNVIKDSSGLDAILCGEYPQYLADSEIAKELEEKFRNRFHNRELVYTKKEYTDLYHDIYTKCSEYEYKENKYVRVWCDLEPSRYNILSNGEHVNLVRSEYYWIKVEPIIWLVESNIAISKDLLFSGLSRFEVFYHRNRDKSDETRLSYFLNEIFKKEIEMDKVYGYEDISLRKQINNEKKEETLESIIEEAKMEMKEILGSDYSYMLNETQEESFQKVKRMSL